MTRSIDAGHLDERELQSMVTMLCARFPESSPAEVQRLVSDAYRSLSGNARIRSHLIPLTLNRCRRTLARPPADTGLTAIAV